MRLKNITRHSEIRCLLLGGDLLPLHLPPRAKQHPPWNLWMLSRCATSSDGVSLTYVAVASDKFELLV